MPALAMVIINLAILGVGSVLFLVATDTMGLLALYAVVVLVGVGISTLFSSGIIWLHKHVEVNSKITSLFLISTSIGAQVRSDFGTLSFVVL